MNIIKGMPAWTPTCPVMIYQCMVYRQFPHSWYTYVAACTHTCTSVCYTMTQIVPSQLDLFVLLCAIVMWRIIQITNSSLIVECVVLYALHCSAVLVCVSSHLDAVSLYVVTQIELCTGFVALTRKHGHMEWHGLESK